MKIKKLLCSAFAIMMFAVQVMPLAAIAADIADAEPEAETPDYYVQNFIITAYYSPLQGQEHYVTGSYAGDIYLNGNGTNGADGTEVYPGMIAAPKKYAFGTKMDVPGVGVVAVHDRGGAILVAGERGYEYDRLDIWMGHGDVGLSRALNWGKRTVEVIVYGINPNVEENIYLEGYSAAEAFVKSTVLSPLEFPHDIYFGAEGDEVTKMQEYLTEWAYLDGEVNGFYGSDTAQAIFQFQLDFSIVSDPDELGAGHFGINTRTKFDAIISGGGLSDEEVRLQKGRTLMTKYTDLYEEKELFASALGLGESGETVRKLQEELVTLGFLRIEPTGFYGETTEHAVFKFQQAQGVVDTAEDRGAGYFGPSTRSALNTVLDNRFKMKSLLAYQREEVEQGRHLVEIPNEEVAFLEEDM